MRVPYSLVSKALALLLLVAAALKLHGLGEGPVSASGIFGMPEVQLAGVEFEAFLAVWLLSGKYRLGSWLTALISFSGFALITAHHGWVGQTSCGCFGKLEVHPWLTLTLDLFVLGMLILARPRRIDPATVEQVRPSVILKPALWGIAGIALASGLLVGLAHAAFGSVPAAVAYLRGEHVSIEPRLVDVGEGKTGEKREVTVRLTNWTDKPVRVFGGTRDCSCTVLNDLPLIIEPRETRSVSVTLAMNGAAGVLNRKAGFLLDEEGFKQVKFAITGRILPGPDRSGSGQ